MISDERLPLPRRNQPPDAAPGLRRLAPLVVTLVALAIIAVATLRGGDPRDSRSAWCLVCPPRGSRVGVDLVLNVLLFIPYGFGLGSMGVSRLRSALLILLTTLLVEFLQMYVVPGRHSSVADVVTNTLGGILGMALAHQTRTLIDPAVTRARLLAVMGLGAWLTLVAASSLAATPSTTDSAYSTRWRPGRTAETDASGRVVSVQVGGVPLTPAAGPIHDPRLDGLRRGDASDLVMQFRPALEGGADARVEIRADSEPTRVVLGQDRADVFLRVHLRASDARLRGPTLRIAGALDSARRARARDTVVVEGHVSRRALRIEFTNGERRAVRELELGPHLGWSFLLPGRTGLPSMARAAADAFWLAFLLLPVGYWAGRSTTRSSRRRRGTIFVAAGAAAAALLIGFWGIPTALGVTPAPPLAWVLSPACLAAGWGTARWRRVQASRRNGVDWAQ